ncbi:prephenate dehydrogenase [Paracoccus aminophilus]|uniref:Prephenate dehydrogenase n=1 Tax=Paracoccus aminophilus JCM 7686 TaxID=1367847 RepID=S5YR38_PARAH|nr:prephenate dehydrogenase [Paracoccus aminophilus]AGT07721.1 prephenate dehydrogenase [Paracoccus aminophilus JCM 7686]
MLSSLPSVCIIGFGAFGALAAELLAPHVAVSVIDPAPEAQARLRAEGLGATELAGLAEVDLVLLAVPVPALASCLREIAPHLRAGQIVIDTCSIKEEPARLMRDLLPEFVEILPTHPMFGPASARSGIAGLQIVLCPEGGDGWRPIAAFLRRALGLSVRRATPVEHDRQAAVTQGLTHLLARAFGELGPRPALRTRTFEMLLAALDLVRNDAAEVYDAVTLGNPHFAPARDRLIAALLAGSPQKDAAPQKGEHLPGAISAE